MCPPSAKGTQTSTEFGSAADELGRCKSWHATLSFGHVTWPRNEPHICFKFRLDDTSSRRVGRPSRLSRYRPPISFPTLEKRLMPMVFFRLKIQWLFQTRTFDPIELTNDCFSKRGRLLTFLRLVFKAYPNEFGISKGLIKKKFQSATEFRRISFPPLNFKAYAANKLHQLGECCEPIKGPKGNHTIKKK